MKNLLSLALIFISTFAFSQIPEPLKNTYVNDFAHVLTPEQVSSLNQNIAGIEKASGVQFAIILINNLPKDNTIEDYTLLISRKWHVGNNKTGLVYVAAIQQHKQRLEKASGLDTIFTSQKSDEILSAIKPSFKSKDYYGGLQILIGQVGTTLSSISTQQPDDQIQIAQRQQQQTQQVVDEDNGSNFITVVGFIAAAIFIMVIWGMIRAVIRRNRPNNYRGNNNMGQTHTHVHHSGNDGFVNGALLGALGALVVNEIIDDSSGDQQFYDDDDNSNRINTNDNDSGSSWGDWGSSDSSSSDSGFSSDDSSSGSSSDW